MKKLIALLIVLVAPVAFAGPFYDLVVSTDSANIGDPIQVDIKIGTNGALTSFSNAVLTVSNGSLISADTAGAGNWSAGGGIAVGSIENGFTLTLNGGRGVDTGLATGDILYSFTYAGVAEGLSIIDASSGNWGSAPMVGQEGLVAGAADSVLPYGEVTIVPEPMTMALLGLGGLFIRRRRA